MLEQNSNRGSIVVVDETGENLGVMTMMQAKQVANDKGLDLVLVQPNGDHPVYKIIDQGKWQYAKKKKEKTQKHKSPDLKQMRYSMAIDHHDVVIKTNQVKSFIEKGHPVRLFIKLKNREKARPEAAVEKLQSVVDMLKSHIQVDKISQSPGFVYIVVHPIQGKTNVQKAD